MSANRLSFLVFVLAMPLQAQRTADSLAADSARARQLAPVVVSGARLGPSTDRRLPATAEPLDVRRAGHGAAALPDLLQHLPGVSMSNDQGSRAQPSLDLRGFALSPVVGVPQGVSVFLDGVRVNEPDAQEVNFDLLPMEAVESAELVPGTSAIRGKNTLAGALVLRTARGEGAPQLRGAYDVGSYASRDARLVGSGAFGGTDALLMLGASREAGYQVASGGETRQLFATLGRRGERGDIALSVLAARDSVSEAGSLPESWLAVNRRANFTGGDFFRPRLLQVTLRGEHTSGAATLRATAFARRNAIEQYNVNAGEANTRAFVTNVSAGGVAEAAIATHVATWPATLSLGGELTRARVDYRVLAEPNTDAPNLPAECEAQGDASALCEDAQARGDDAALYAQAVLEPTSSLSLLLSARGDRSRVPFTDRRDDANSGTSTYQRISPKAGVTYVRGGLRLRGSVGSAFRAPAALELACASRDATCPLPFSLGADPALAPVVAWTYETGADYAPAAGTALALTLYHTNVRDEIVFVSAERAAGYFQNVAATRRDGLETSFSARLPAGGRVFASYTFTDATYRVQAALASVLDDNVVTPGSQFAQSPRHRGTAGVGVTRLMGTMLLDGELSARAVSSSWLRGDEANRMPPVPGYVVSDLRVAIRRERLSATLRVDNLLDRRYETYGVYAGNAKGAYGEPAPAEPSVERFLTPAYPRTVSVGLSLEP